MFRKAVTDGIAGDGLTIVEVVTDRRQNVAQHRAVSAGGGSPPEGAGCERRRVR